MLLIPTPNHTEQYNNARKVKAMGVAEILDQQSLNKETLLGATERALNSEEHVERARQVMEEVDGADGLETAVRIIRQVAEEGWSNNVSA
jgi:UDP:flavonoid glycosyltransferase YjiC (YdhE family)